MKDSDLCPGGRRWTRTKTLLGSLSAVAIVCAGCASPDDKEPASVDLATLKTGGLATEPTAFTPKFHQHDDFRLIEARRMLDYLVHPFDVDPDLIDRPAVKLISNAENMVGEESLPENFKPVGEKYQVLAGAFVAQSNGSLRNSKNLIISVLRFPTEDAGRAAAAEIDAILGSSGPVRRRIVIDDRPDARVSSADDRKAISVMAHGPYVILTNASVPKPDPDRLVGTIKKAIDLQVAKLDQQQPTPLDDIFDLPQDPDGIMRRAAPVAKDYSDPLPIVGSDADFGPYRAEGALHFLRNPIEVRKAFEEGGVDLIGRRAGVVYRTRDRAAAVRLRDSLSKIGKDDDILDPPPGLPEARCVRYDYKDRNRRYNAQCALVYQRYVATVFFDIVVEGKGRQALYERAAAQYSILAKSE